MKKIYLSTIILFTLSCKEHKELRVFNKEIPCECEKNLQNDSIFHASNIKSENISGKKTITFNCVAMDIAIASVSDTNGENEICSNIYDVKCSSENNHQITLAPNFTYTTDQVQVTQDDEKLFLTDAIIKKDQYFKFYLNEKRELQFVTKIIID